MMPGGPPGLPGPGGPPRSMPGSQASGLPSGSPQVMSKQSAGMPGMPSQMMPGGPGMPSGPGGMSSGPSMSSNMPSNPSIPPGAQQLPPGMIGNPPQPTNPTGSQISNPSGGSSPMYRSPFPPQPSPQMSPHSQASPMPQ